MPYVNCPECCIRSFVLAPWSSAGRCPNCEVPLVVPRQSVTGDMRHHPYWPPRGAGPDPQRPAEQATA